MHKTIILGIGNYLLSDEGVGIHAMNFIKNNNSNKKELCFYDAGTLSFSLTSWLDSTKNMIILDAAILDKPAGSVEVFENEQLDKFAKTNKLSAHEVGLVDLLSIAHITNTIPKNYALIAIQPQSLDWGLELTDNVKKSLPKVEIETFKLLKKWG